MKWGNESMQDQTSTLPSELPIPHQNMACLMININKLDILN